MPDVPFDALLATAKRVAAILRDGEVPFLLAGGLASWARGGPPTEHDVDVVVRPGHAEAALALLEEGGMRTERPPEDWLVKAYDDEVMIDVIFRPSGELVDDEMFERATEMEVGAVAMLVIAADDLIVSKLCALNEHHLDFEGLLELTRALREQVDWPTVQARTAASPFARAFLFLAEELGLVELATPGLRAGAA